MQDSPTIPPAARFDPLREPFHLLGTDPGASEAQIEAAYALALQQPEAPQVALAEARAAILDPARRLACELGYPIDSTPAQLEAFYAGLSNSAPALELLPAAERLAPLSRANFLAGLAARGPAPGALLLALLDAHVAIDVSEIYATLRTLRNRAGFPTPSLVSVSQGLSELLGLHAQAAIAGYEPVEGAAAPVLECTERVQASGDHYRAEALAVLLGAYRRSTAELRTTTGGRIESACQMLQQGADDDAAVDALAGPLRRWTALWRPLMLIDAARGLLDPEFETAIDQVRLLLDDLSLHQRYEPARKIAALAADMFSPVPGAAEHFDEAAALLRELSLKAAINSLRELIARFDADPALLAAALKKDGFGAKSSAEARELWQAFGLAVESTRSSEFVEQPWMLTRDLAIRLGGSKATARAACRLIGGLIAHGESVPADPAILDALRDDLVQIERRHPGAMPKKRLLRIARRSALAGLALAAVAGVFLGYRNFDALRSLARTWDRSVLRSEREIVPPVGKGQHFARASVRYCHFQEERLRVIKEDLHGVEDFRAYNVLANDYNSRCSDFFYQDEDLKIVEQEVDANKKVLDADARRILAGWPWHAAAGDAPAPPVK
jgi:hypothetical protein